MTPEEARRREEARNNRQMQWRLAREARREPTPAEKALWERVRAHRCGGLSIRRQTLVGPFRLDFYCPAKKLVIEVDGGIHQEPEVARRDRDRQQALEHDFGFRFLRLTNDVVLRRPDEAVAAILAAARASEDMSEDVEDAE